MLGEWVYIVCQNAQLLVHYNFDVRQLILIIFGRNVTRKKAISHFWRTHGSDQLTNTQTDGQTDVRHV